MDLQRLRWKRRGFGRFIPVVWAMLLLFGVGTLGAAGRPGWPMHQADARHTGFVDTRAPDRLPQPVWTFRSCFRSLYEPRIQGNSVYIMTPFGALAVLDAETGRVVRRFNLGTYSRGQPDLLDGYFVYRYYHVSRRLMAVRAESLTARLIQWQQPLDPTRWPVRDRFNIEVASPDLVAVYGGRERQAAVIRLGPRGPRWVEPTPALSKVSFPPLIQPGEQSAYAVVERNRLVRWSLKDGAWVWDIRLPAPAAAGPTATDDRVCLPLSLPALVCYNRTRGEESFRLAYPEPPYGPAVPGRAGRLAALTTTGRLLEFDLRRRRVREVAAVGSPPSSPPLFHRDAYWFGTAAKRIYRVSPSGQVHTSDPLKSPPIRILPLAGGVLVGGRDYAVRMVSGQDGRPEPAWKFALECPILGGTAMDDEFLYVPVAGSSLAALDRKTGRQVWRRDTGDKIVTPPLVAGDVVFVQNRRYQVIALKKQDGNPVWNAPSLSGFKYAMTWAEGVLFLDRPGALVGIRWPEKEQVWQSGPEAGMDVHGWTVFSSPAVLGSRVVVTTNHQEIVAWDWRRSRELWRRRGDTDPAVPPVILAGSVWVPLRTGDLLALDPATGRERLRVPVGAWVGNPVGGHKNRIYIALPSGRVRAVDATTGRRLWEVDLGAAAVTSPVTTRNLILIGVNDGVVALDPDKGAIRWRLREGYAPVYPPLAAEGYLYVLGGDGYVHAYREAPNP